MNCQNCGASLRPDATRCVKCGSHLQHAPQPVQQQPQQAPQYAGPAAPPHQRYAQPAPQYQQGPIVITDEPRSKLAAALMAFFLGWLGVHNFYLGYFGRGIVQVILTVISPFTACATLAIVVIWALIEFVLILTGVLRDKYNRPLV